MTEAMKYCADGIADYVTDEQRLNVVLDSARANLHVRRPDGSKAPLLWAAEEVFRLREVLAVEKQENERLRSRPGTWQELMMCGGGT